MPKTIFEAHVTDFEFTCDCAISGEFEIYFLEFP